MHVEHRDVEVLTDNLEEAWQIRFAAEVAIPGALARLDTIVAAIHIIGDTRYYCSHVPSLKCGVYVFKADSPA